MSREEINIHFLGQFIQEGIYLVPDDMEDYSADLGKEKREEKNVDNANTSIKEEITPKLPQLGEFRRKVLMLVDNHSDQIITEEEKEFFGKLIPAIKLTWPDIAIVNIHSITNNEQDLFDFVNTYDYKVLLAFTGQLAAFKLIAEGELYQSIKSAGKIHLISNRINELNASKPQKLKLWNELQQIF